MMQSSPFLTDIVTSSEMDKDCNNFHSEQHSAHATPNICNPQH